MPYLSSIQCVDAPYFSTHVRDYGQVRDGLEDPEPGPDVLGTLTERPPRGRDQLVGVQPDLDDVVDQREEGRQRERSHEQRHEAVLYGCKK